jgi:hypothetical protein
MTAVGVFAAGNLVDPKGALAGVASGGQFERGHLHASSGLLPYCKLVIVPLEGGWYANAYCATGRWLVCRHAVRNLL